VSWPPGSGQPPAPPPDDSAGSGGPEQQAGDPQQPPGWAPPAQPGWAPSAPAQQQPGWTPPQQTPGWTPPAQQGWTPPPSGQQPPAWTPPQQQTPTWTPPPGQQPPAWAPPAQQPAWAPSQQYGYGPGGWQPPPRRESRWPIVLILLLVGGLVLAVIVAAALLANGIGALTGGSTLQTLTVGQCFNGGRADDSETTIIRSVETIDCAEAHESELAATFLYPEAGVGDEYPGDEVLSRFAERECTLRFADYVGVPFSQSIYGMTYAYPLEFNWVLSDTSIQCIVHPAAGQSTMTGSVRNSRR
jgi:hypothetical protein